MSDDSEWWASQEDLNHRARVLLEKWNALVAQAEGATLGGRQDIPAEVRDRVVDDRRRFREFIDGPLYPHNGPQMRRWYARYASTAQLVADALPEDEPLSRRAAPARLPAQVTPGDFAGLGMGTAALIGLALWAWGRRGK